MRIVVLDGYTENPGDLSWDGFAALGELTVYDRTAPGRVLILERAKGAEALIVNKTLLAAPTIEALLPELRYVGVLATGYDAVDAAYAAEKGITVCNIPEYGTSAVAQIVFALLLELCHHAGEHDRSVRRGDWSASSDFCYWNYPLVELSGKTLGIVGFGRIGRKTAEIALAFGMDVLACDERQDPALETDRIRYVPLGDLLEKSDVVSLHCPLALSTRGMINTGAIARMKPGAMLINTARGALVVEQDLAEALNSGRIAGAAVDVVSVEPIRKDNPLLAAKNCIITPHIAWAPKESRRRLMDAAAANLAAFIAGSPQNVVN